MRPLRCRAMASGGVRIPVRVLLLANIARSPRASMKLELDESALRAPYIVQLKNIPWECEPEHIEQFFRGVSSRRCRARASSAPTAPRRCRPSWCPPRCAFRAMNRPIGSSVGAAPRPTWPPLNAHHPGFALVEFATVAGLKTALEMSGGWIGSASLPPRIAPAPNPGPTPQQRATSRSTCRANGRWAAASTVATVAGSMAAARGTSRRGPTKQANGAAATPSSKLRLTRVRASALAA